MATKPFSASLVSASARIGDVNQNLQNVARTVRAEAQAGASLVVFPEMHLTGYMLRDSVQSLALALDGSEIGQLVDLARETGTHIVTGFPRATEVRGVVTNCAVLVGPRGVVGHYDKAQLPTFSVFEEGLYFQPGSQLPVFQTPLGRLGLCICYDLFFPEVTKTLALRGADILIVPSASPTMSQRYFEAIFAARAVETTSWILYTNVAGAQDTLVFWAGAQAWNPRGDRVALAPYLEEGVARATIDLSLVGEMRTKRPTLRDTRLDLLQELVAARAGSSRPDLSNAKKIAPNEGRPNGSSMGASTRAAAISPARTATTRTSARAPRRAAAERATGPTFRHGRSASPRRASQRSSRGG
ncbi:MAG: carbon-nitrogen hydrolase family protein [Thermoplasmatota archaeon]